MWKEIILEILWSGREEEEELAHHHCKTGCLGKATTKKCVFLVLFFLCLTHINQLRSDCCILGASVNGSTSITSHLKRERKEIMKRVDVLLFRSIDWSFWNVFSERHRRVLLVLLPSASSHVHCWKQKEEEEQQQYERKQRATTNERKLNRISSGCYDVHVYTNYVLLQRPEAEVTPTSIAEAVA